ncbi:MAG: hypothetical protein ACT452_12410 [Microthrixaceae bacterium]
MSARSQRILALAVAALVAASGARAGAAQTTDPTVAIDRTGTAAGETILITGTGWPNAATLIVELCGHGGLRGSADCDVPQQRTAGVGPSGTFSVELTTGQPPSPCPCVVKATDQSSQIATTAPIAVAGMATVPITADDVAAVRALEISAAEITGGHRWAELFGAGGRRVLEVTLVNTGPLAIDAPKVNVSWGSGSNPDGFVKPPEVDRMEPGASQVLTIPLHRSALTIGAQTAVVEVQGLGSPVVARASTTGYPWGLLAVALVVLQLLLLRLRDRLRRRVHRGHEPTVEDPALDRVVLELPAAPPDLEPTANGDEVSTPVVVDLGELERQDAPRGELASEEPMPAARPLVVSGGDTDSLDGAWATTPSTNGVSSNGVWTSGVVAADATTNGAVTDRGPTVDSADGATDSANVAAKASNAAQVELAIVRQQAKAAVARVADMTDALVASCSARVRALEGQAAERLREAASHHEAALALLAAARERADELTTAAAEAAAGLRRDAAGEREAAELAAAAVHAQRDELLEAAIEAVDEVLQELDDHVQMLVAKAERSPATASPSIDLDRPVRRAPRLGGFDDRLAHAVSRAVASSSVDGPSRN